MILYFDHPHASHDDARTSVGGKGASLWAMTRLGLPVPPGFTIPIADARRIADRGLGDADREALGEGLARIGAQVGRRFGDGADPLLLSIRSGAARSMPGMMDTILNLGAGDNPWEDLACAVEAVARSWHGERARAYRAHAGLGDEGGTAVTVQAMVFGDRDAQSATGVAFSRCPTTGAPGAVGDLLFEAQGEAVVAGTRTPEPLDRLIGRLPEAAAALQEALRRLEAHYRDMVDVEFTVESGRLWLLQARPGKRSAAAAARIAVDLAAHPEIRLSRAEAVARVPDLLGGTPLLTRAAGSTPLARGMPAAPGLATGALALTPDAAIDMSEAAPVILARAETSPEDVHGIGVSAGVLTALGGPMSHAALVAREWGIPAVVGCAALRFVDGGAMIGRVRVGQGEIISIDGSTGEVFAGAVAGEVMEDPHAATLRTWAQAMKGDAA